MSGRKLLGVIIAGQDCAITERIIQIIEEEVAIDFLGATADMESTLTLITEKDPDIVILDTQIGMDSTTSDIMKLLITMRFKFPDLVIMVLSNTVHARLNCMAYGADYFFDKSYDFYGIPAVIKNIQMKCPD